MILNDALSLQSIWALSFTAFTTTKSCNDSFVSTLLVDKLRALETLSKALRWSVLALSFMIYSQVKWLLYLFTSSKKKHTYSVRMMSIFPAHIGDDGAHAVFSEKSFRFRSPNTRGCRRCGLTYTEAGRKHERSADDLIRS